MLSRKHQCYYPQTLTVTFSMSVYVHRPMISYSFSIKCNQCNKKISFGKKILYLSIQAIIKFYTSAKSCIVFRPRHFYLRCRGFTSPYPIHRIIAVLRFKISICRIYHIQYKNRSTLTQRAKRTIYKPPLHPAILF